MPVQLAIRATETWNPASITAGVLLLAGLVAVVAWMVFRSARGPGSDD